MVAVLSGSFIRTILRRIDDCSNPVQLREYLNRYGKYLSVNSVSSAFNVKVNFWLGSTMDSFLISQCECLLEDIDDLADTTTMPKCVFLDEVEKELDTSFLDMDNDDFNCPFEEELLRNTFVLSNGNKVDICRLLKIDNTELNKKILQYKLKDNLNEVRRDYRSNCTKYKE